MSAKKVKPEHIAAAKRAVEGSTDPEQLRRLMERAQAMGVADVYDAAFAKRLSLLADDTPGSMEHDLSKSMFAVEQIRSEAAGKAIRLSKARQKLSRVGVMKLLEDSTQEKAVTDGFDLLIGRSLPELTSEAIVLRHRQHFSDTAIEAARLRLEAVGVDVSKLTAA